MLEAQKTSTYFIGPWAGEITVRQYSQKSQGLPVCLRQGNAFSQANGQTQNLTGFYWAGSFTQWYNMRLVLCDLIHLTARQTFYVNLLTVWETEVSVVKWPSVRVNEFRLNRLIALAIAF